MKAKTKYYVVWDGLAPGIYDSWEECKAQVANYPRAKYKSFTDLETATLAYRGNPDEWRNIFKGMTKIPAQHVNYGAYPEIDLNAIAVDAACASNPGPVEYQGVRVGTGEKIFHFGPLPGGTNNIGEYLAIVHAAAMLDKAGDYITTIYSDSITAQSWIKHRHSRTKIAPTPENARILEILRRADAWVAQHLIRNPIRKWETEKWGEIPADFGRKK